MSEPLYGVFGASGFGREVMPLARAQFIALFGQDKLDRLVFIDDNPPADELNGHKVFTYEEFIAKSSSVKKVCLAIADAEIREKLSKKLLNDDVQAWQVKADNVFIMDGVKIEKGAILSPFVTLLSNSRVGKYFHANIYSYVAHDCVIGDYVTFAPNVHCNGNVHIEDYAYIGTGAILRQGTPEKPLRIGKGAVVGMGAVVTKDVPAGTVVVGNPARPLQK